MKDLVKFNIPIYRGELWIVFAADYNKALKELDIRLNKTPDDCNAFVVRNSAKGAYCVFIHPDRIYPDTVAHEAVHICNDVFADRGVTIDTIHDEHQAYFIQWIVMHIFIAARDRRMKVRMVATHTHDIELGYGKKFKRMV